MKIHAAGFNSQHKEDFSIARPSGAKTYLLVAFKTDAALTIDGVKYDISPKSAIIFTPECRHSISAKSDDYIDDWVFFSPCSAQDEAFLKSLEIPFNTPLPHYDSFYMCDIIRHISIECVAVNEQRDELTDSLLRLSLLKISELVHTNRGTSDGNRYYNQLMELRLEINTHPEQHWTVDSMAQRLKISAPYFQRLYKSTFGISVIADVLDIRMNCAKSYLSSTDYKIYTIAEKCGYNNTTHFMRQFKKAVGLTPSEYRFCG